jgi:hypothetical protein
MNHAACVHLCISFVFSSHFAACILVCPCLMYHALCDAVLIQHIWQACHEVAPLPELSLHDPVHSVHTNRRCARAFLAPAYRYKQSNACPLFAPRSACVAIGPLTVSSCSKVPYLLSTGMRWIRLDAPTAAPCLLTLTGARAGAFFGPLVQSALQPRQSSQHMQTSCRLIHRIYRMNMPSAFPQKFRFLLT